MNVEVEWWHLNPHGTNPPVSWAPSTPNGPGDQDLCSVEQLRFILCLKGDHCSVPVSVCQIVKLTCGNVVRGHLHRAVPGENLFVRARSRCVYEYGRWEGSQRESGESLAALSFLSVHGET